IGAGSQSGWDRKCAIAGAFRYDSQWEDAKMSLDRRLLRWNGWGLVDAPDLLGEKAEQFWAWAGRAFGMEPLPHTPAKDRSAIELPACRLAPGFLSELESLCGRDNVKTDHYERIWHARGRSYHDLLHLRAGHIGAAPDAVVYPETGEQVLELIRVAARENMALVPFGGGSSVVGGVTASAPDGRAGVVTVDMTRMDRLIEIDEESMRARIQAGIYGPALEESLQARGFTLGHYPQSFEYSTLGGWIAARSAGHQSNKYGKAEEWFVSARMATPRGFWDTEHFPGSAAGPQMKHLVPGSEGALGIITEATVRIHRVPEIKDYRGYLFPSFEAGVAATRDMMQSEVPTAMIRLSDLTETFFYNALDTGGAGADAPAVFCLMLVGLEGGAAEVESAREQCKTIIAGHGGFHIGEAPGRTWYTGRFLTPYLRDPLMDRGLGVDTLETAACWSSLLSLYKATAAAMEKALETNAPRSGLRSVVMAHVSHSYRDGASLYFTFVFPRDLDREVEQWLAVKRAASEAIVANGGTISHHHGIGTDHMPWLIREKGPVAMELLRAVKRVTDPKGILNPGKLLE
ncbi:MAG TPA: FAD-binding oxidoreductase, partial [Candidatus Hydrogenedentes bacterium]|nr:FAD-binding oxidoreductase [Candidatus Hydrogenedentota bacterium]